jgi:hypothetical protein
MMVRGEGLLVATGEEMLVRRVGRMAIAPVLKTGAAKVAYRFESCTLRLDCRDEE